MYQINLGDKILYYPGSDDAVIYDTELNEEIGMAGELRLKVPSENMVYSQLTQGALISVLKDNREIWRGEIRSIKVDFNKVADVYALEDMAWLGDESIAPAKVTNETYAQRFQMAIDTYNAERPAERRFTAGYLTNVAGADTCNWTTEYGWSLLDCLRNCIAKDTGYVRVRRVVSGGSVTRYIDIVKLDDYGVQATQPIEYGYNLLDYVKDSDYGNLTNVLTPYGDELDSEVYSEYNARLQGTTIADSNSISIYGRHAKSVVFDNVTDVNALNSLAQAYLTRYSQPQLTMEVQAVDLASIENVGDIKIGDSVRITARPFGIDQWLYLTQIRRDIQNIDKNTITLSGHVQGGRSLTAQTINTVEAIENLPSKSNILEAAKKNALEILNGENGGVIYFVSNEDNQIIEQRIMNNADIDQATKAWRWNINGLAYLSRTYPSDPWNVGVAITMDGQIVADYITTGVLNANLIKAGIISDYNGKFSLNMNTGAINMADARLTNANISGHIQANSGYIGSSQYGFIIGDTQIWTVNGPYNIVDTWDIGSYLGMNGFCVNSSMGHSHVMGGEISVQGYLYCYDLEIKKNGYSIISQTYSDFPFFQYYTGGVYTGRYVPWSGSSDRRLKKNIEPINIEFVRNIFELLKPVKFNYINDDKKRTEFGLIAQDLEETFKDVNEQNNAILLDVQGYKAINYEKMVGLLIPAVKDLYETVEKQAQQISEMQAQINELVKIIKEGKDG